MDLAAFDALVKQHKESLEQRLRRASTMHSNLNRMIEEAIRTITERAEKDREEISLLFFTLVKHQEDEIMILRGELGIGGNRGVDSSFNYDEPAEEGQEEDVSVASPVKKLNPKKKV